MKKIEEKFHVLVKIVLRGIQMLLLVVFLGYMMIWIMMPTNTFWLHWLPRIHAKTDSVYLGVQGTNFLIYTFPVLFIAVLACVYLHFQKKVVHNNGRDKRSSDDRLAFWNRPAVVQGPFGIVSWPELSVILMFIALLVWSFTSYLTEMFANISQQSVSKIGLQVWQAKLQSCGLMFGLLGNICLAFLFFPVTRGSPILRLVGLTSESSLKYHIWLGHITMTLFAAHGSSYLITWSSTNKMSELLKWTNAGIANAAGEVALLGGLAMWATSCHYIRRKAFELFLYAHYLYVLFIAFFVFHVGFAYSCIALPGFFLFLLDRGLRFLQSQQEVRLVSARVLSCEVVELTFAKNPELTYNPTSIIFVCIPNISKLQWHPFTITSSCRTDPERLSIVIKNEGLWSSDLYNRLSSLPAMDHLNVSIEGPYSPETAHFIHRHDKLVLVSGGSGITPFISIIRDLLFTANAGTRKAPQILLICAFKKSRDLEMLDLFFPASGCTLDTSCLQLQIEAYVTRENKQVIDLRKNIQYLQFRANKSGVLVAATLGVNSWLYLSAIILASFTIFLLLTGTLTRYYTHPIDSKPGRLYSHASVSALNILFIGVSVAMTTTIAFLWNRRNNVRESTQVQNMDTPHFSETSPYNFSIELESIPHSSQALATQVHYGERPNLKRMLSKYEKSRLSIGVLVSGPVKLRREVAEICSSASTSNLHFDSVSFTW